MKLIPTFSPQGDGNSSTSVSDLKCVTLVDPYLFPARGRKLTLIALPLILSDKLIPTFSPQGDGNRQLMSEGLPPRTVYVDPYLFPARGRKRLIPAINREDWTTVDPYLFPARGRKPQLHDKPSSSRTYVDPYLFPARGRKRTAFCTICHLHSFLLIPTFSPQGDGNASLIDALGRRSIC